ncbi:hypothetical protein JCM8202_001826 [Rhodotorula sphaerocarpa]
MTKPAAADSRPRINATRPENLAASAKRSARAQLLAQYSQLLPLAPAPAQSYTHSLLSALGASSAATQLAPPKVRAHWDDLSHAVWVKNDDDMNRLWKQGFFGKGFLSRSEPSWKRRVENRRAHLEGREQNLTAEEITAQRRLERKGAKLAKKLERDAEKLVAASVAAAAAAAANAPEPPHASISTADKGKGKEIETETGEALEDAADPGEELDEPDVPPEAWQLDAEHSQLQPEEAFFLSFAVGCLALSRTNLEDDDPAAAQRPLSILETFRLFLESATPALSLPPSNPSDPSSPAADPRLNRLDSPFLLSYAAYHHFRSLGWVARSGTKFCVDWVLYGQGGPVGGHAEFAVVIVPTYVDPKDAASNPFRSTSTLAVHSDPELRAAEQEEREHLQGEGERKNSWRWFHTINRVCSGVKKTLVLLHVVIPPLSSLPAERDWVARHPAQALARFEMREVVVRRFLAGRMRD